MKTTKFRCLLVQISLIIILAAVAQADEIYCNCGDGCAACDGNTPAYMKASLVNLQACPQDFHNQVAAWYPCFGGSMEVILKQDQESPCGYYYDGPAFNLDGSPYPHRLKFYLNFNGDYGQTEFWVLTQQDCGGWFDMCWSVVTAENTCRRSGAAQFDSLCNAPTPDIEDGFVCWTQAVGADGNCPGCEPNDINDTCEDLSCDTLGDYTFFQGPMASYCGPMVIYSPSKCQNNGQKGNKIRTAKISCPNADFVCTQAVSSAPADIAVTSLQSSCQSGDTAGFIIEARRGTGTVTLTATFYQKAYAAECIGLKTTKTVVIKIESDSGDACCQDIYKPVLLAGSPGNVSTPVRAGSEPLKNWPAAKIYSELDCTDIEVILPGRFSSVIFNDSRPPQYMRSWSAEIQDTNDIVIVSAEGAKYIYSEQNDYKISMVKNALDVNIAEFIYDVNGLPTRQNDLTDSSLYICYQYDSNNLLSQIIEHAGSDYRQFDINYDDNGFVSYINDCRCSQCGDKGGRRYFYNADGTLKYEKNSAGVILYEYLFDSAGRLTEKWLGQKSQNKPVTIINYMPAASGYIADINNYTDDQTWRAVREYRSDSGIVTSRQRYQQLNQLQGDPNSDADCEYFIYDYAPPGGNLASMTHIMPSADFNGISELSCRRTEIVYDVNTGHVLQQNRYDGNNNPTVFLENRYEYIDSAGSVTDDVNSIFRVRLVESFDVYGANTVYSYNDISSYPERVLTAKSNHALSSGQLAHEFEYDGDKNITRHKYIETQTGRVQLTVNYGYDAFGNLLWQQYTDSNDINDTIEYYYNDYNQRVRTKTAAGVVSGLCYGNCGRLVSEFTLADANQVNIDEPNLISQAKYIYGDDGLLCLEARAVDTSEFEYDKPSGWVYSRYIYDDFGNVCSSIEDVNGLALESLYEYDRQGHLKKVTYPGGKWKQFFFDGKGLLEYEIVGAGTADVLISEYRYDENGNRIEQITPDGSCFVFEYDDFDRLISQKQLSSTDANVGIETAYEYNLAGDITKETAYDTNGFPLSEKIYGYDNIGRCCLVRDRAAVYSDDDANDFITCYAFDCQDNITKKIIKGPGSTDLNTVDDVNDIIVEYKYDLRSRIKEIIDACSAGLSFTYNGDGKVESTVNQLALTTTNTIDKYGRVVKTTSPAGSYQTAEYDSFDRIKKQTVYDWNDVPVRQKRFSYDALGNITELVVMADAGNFGDCNSFVDSVIQYDINETTGLVDSESFIYNQAQKGGYCYEYDPVGRIVKFTDPAANTTEIFYDANWPSRIAYQQVTFNDPCEPIVVTTCLEYDDFGRVKSSRVFNNNSGDFNDIITGFEYNDAGDVIKQIRPGGLEIEYEYDCFGNVTKKIEDRQDVNKVSQFVYDRLGRVVSMTAFDPNVQATKFEYNKNSRLAKVIFPDDSCERYRYDATGKIIKKITRNGREVYYSYDLEGNIVELADDLNTPQFLIEFDYDPMGMITFARRQVAGTTESRNEFEYNGFGKVEKEMVFLPGIDPVKIEYSYDPAGNIVTRQAGSVVYRYCHDGLGRVTGIKHDGSDFAEIEYLASAVKRQKIIPAGIEYTAGFDEIARLSSCVTVDSANSVIHEIFYGYDDASNRYQVGKDYRYDRLSRITKAEYDDATTEEFSYRPFGLRQTAKLRNDFEEIYYNNELNQYTRITTDTSFLGFTYDSNLYWDDNGNLNIEQSRNLEYQYDLSGNLVKVNSGTETIAEFTYDGLGRRVSKNTSQGLALYCYDLNNRIIAELSVVDSNSSKLESEYLYGSGFGDVIAKLRPKKDVDVNDIKQLGLFCQGYLYQSGQAGYDPNYDYDSSGMIDLVDFASFAEENSFSLPPSSDDQWYYVKDAIGSIVAAVGDKGALKQYKYSCFGVPEIGRTESGFAFAGYFYDAEIGKYYCLNRYYNPDTGSFLSPDPLLYADSLNAYQYCENNPLLLTDRLGLKSSLTEELQFLTGFGAKRAEAVKLSETLKKNCQNLNDRCISKPCIGSKQNPVCRKSQKCFAVLQNAIDFDESLNTESAKAAAVGVLAGSTQGLLNTVNGVQDGVVGVANLGLGIWNYSGALVCDKRLDYIPSPDWSKGLLTQEGDLSHGVSKFLGGQGALTLATAGANHWKNIRLANKAKPAATAVRQGIYEFSASSGKKYIGQSSNIPGRIGQHLKSGKLLARDFKTLKTTRVPGGRVAREIAEQARIDAAGGVGKLENIRNAIGPARKHLLVK